MQNTAESLDASANLKRDFFKLLADDTASKRAEATTDAEKRTVDALQMQLQMAMQELMTNPHPDRLAVAPLFSICSTS